MKLQQGDVGGEDAERVRDLLLKRADRVRLVPTWEDEEQVLPAAEFPVGDEQYVIPLSQLRETVPLRGVTAVPLANSSVVGIFRYHGRILTVLSLASLLGVRGWRTDPAVLLIVDRGGGELVALDCESVPVGITLPMALVEVSRAGSQEADIEVTLPGRGLIHLIDVPRLVSQRLPGR